MTKKFKEITIKTLTILLPVILLVLFELFLRLINFGHNPSLFIKDDLIKGNYIMNPDVVKNYFINYTQLPSVSLESFSAQKGENTCRIFVLGESSAKGFPYKCNGSFHRMLKYRLERTYTNQNIEIINLGVTAINSYTLLDFSDEVLKMNPDAVLIYTGHNEYYGALGTGSNQKLGNNRFFVKLSIRLKKFKIVQLGFLIPAKIKSLFTPNNIAEKQTMMQQMAKDQEVVFGSKEYALGLQRNLNTLFYIFQGIATKLLISCSK